MAKRQRELAGKQKSPSADRHKPARLIRVKPRLAEQLDVLAEQNETSTTAEANRAIRELLQREKLWPPAADDKN